MGGGTEIILNLRLLIVMREILGVGEAVETLAVSVSPNNLLPAAALAS